MQDTHVYTVAKETKVKNKQIRKKPVGIEWRKV